LGRRRGSWGWGAFWGPPGRGGREDINEPGIVIREGDEKVARRSGGSQTRNIICAGRGYLIIRQENQILKGRRRRVFYFGKLQKVYQEMRVMQQGHLARGSKHWRVGGGGGFCG